MSKGQSPENRTLVSNFVSLLFTHTGAHLNPTNAVLNSWHDDADQVGGAGVARFIEDDSAGDAWVSFHH